MIFHMEIALPDLAATMALGARIGGALKPGDLVALSGPLGAGKTELARAILRARGVMGDVPSPTFTLVQPYETPGLTIHHYDLYRLKHAAELAEMGLEDALDDGAALVEWPERASLPGEMLMVRLSDGTAGRKAMLEGPARWAVLERAHV